MVKELSENAAAQALFESPVFKKGVSIYVPHAGFDSFAPL